ncbi:MAG: V-type ATP synthase subunit E family protein [Armatimonadota bacterium]|nr:V-type ATP synthase subunit E family protein [Armatimonadota bacterium]MDR7447712.1 V-type ATP synthase subunit E family protein [Armatimonadota bacterium]MDR7458487.1 V-type ATP synthase subunit E family protein [Armatimonadota bacterium]MDR7479953.1 V-type ATP synthase subunit E family protein [Armatimonadota bacterium]MDR7488137.1 V-type ATP synthase subunit E family protein [Armatimonadota bacterium]
MAHELIALLEREAAAERERVLAAARAEADEIRRAAEAEAREELERQREAVEAEVRTARVRAQSTARLQAQALVLAAKDEALNAVFSRAAEALEAVVRDRARYARVLDHLVAEGLNDFPDPVVVEAHPDDLEPVRAAVARLRADTEVRPAPDVRAGVRLRAPDGRYVVLNTLPQRLERARPALLAEVARVLWG